MDYVYRLMDSIEAVVGLKENRWEALGRIWRGVSPVHCWEGNDVLDEESGEMLTSTCFRWRGHRGRHEWTPDSEISVTFQAPAS